MALFQIVRDGIVENVIVAPDDAEIVGGGSSLRHGEDALAAPDGAVFMQVSGAAIGWVVAGGTLVAPSSPVVEPDAAALVSYAADKRWETEMVGILFAGVPIATDDRSKIMIMGARVAAAADPGWSTVWHGKDGQTYPVDAAAMIAISDAVQAHVNAGFATFAAVKAAIDSGEITTTAAIDEAFAAA